MSDARFGAPQHLKVPAWPLRAKLLNSQTVLISLSYGGLAIAALMVGPRGMPTLALAAAITSL